VRALLGVMLAALDRLAATRPIEATLIRAPTVSRALTEGLLARAATRVRVVDDQRFAAVAANHLALCASGTATLEVGLLGTPMVVLYRVAPLTYLLARMLVEVPHVALVNLVLGGEIVPELLQGAATPERIAREVKALLGDPGRLAEQRRRFSGLRAALGESGASRRAAEEVLRFVGLP
jgi:lipid-A-disaccharide synthase